MDAGFEGGHFPPGRNQPLKKTYEKRLKSYNLYVVNRFNEIVKEIPEGYQFRIYSPKQIENQKRYKEFLKDKIKWTGISFNKINVNEMRIVNKMLNANESLIIVNTMCNIELYSNAIKCDNGEDMTIEWLIETTKLSKTSVYQAIKSLIDKGIISKNTTKKKITYYMNPWYFSKGKYINMTLRDMFKEYVVLSMGCKTSEEILVQENHSRKKVKS